MNYKRKNTHYKLDSKMSYNLPFISKKRKLPKTHYNIDKKNNFGHDFGENQILDTTLVNITSTVVHYNIDKKNDF